MCPVSDKFLCLFFSLHESNIYFNFASSVTFLSCFLHPGSSFKNSNMWNLFSAPYAAHSNLTSVLSGLLFPVTQKRGPWPWLQDFLQTYSDPLCSALVLHSRPRHRACLCEVINQTTCPRAELFTIAASPLLSHGFPSSAGLSFV